MSVSELTNIEQDHVQRLRALMALNQQTVADLSMRTQVPAENIEAYLLGVTAAISDASYKELFTSLGCIDSEELSLHDGRVHFWHVDMKRRRNGQNLYALATLMKELGEHQAMALPKQNKITPILIKSNEVRIVLFVKTPSFMRLNVADLGLSPGNFTGNQSLTDVPDYYYNLIMSKALRPNYFDLVLEGTYINEDIDLLRMSALEHDITLSAVIEFITQHDRRVTHAEETNIVHIQPNAESADGQVAKVG